MTTVPVLWLSWHDEILARGYADQALIEAVLARDLWSPPCAIDFDHHEIRGDFPPVDGAVIIVPARHHVDDIDRLVDELDRLAWAVVILTGDEEWNFDWARIGQTRSRRLWIQAPEPEHGDVSYLIPCGWYRDTIPTLAAARDEYTTKPLRWFFAGQVTNPRRRDCVHALRTTPGGALVETAGFLQGLPTSEYSARMAAAKVAPCPSGPVQTDTARPMHAMETGTIPVCDLERPNPPQYDYWALLFGKDHPLPTIREWATFPQVLEELEAGWPGNANRIYAWWQQWKRRTALHLDNDIRSAAGLHPAPIDAEDLITVVVTTSPIPSHPSTAVIDETLDSIRAQLPRAEIIVTADGVRPEQADRRADYDEYLRRLLWATNFRWHNVLPVLADEWVHQANTTRAALDHVVTPLVLFMEHDTPLCGDIPWDGLARVVRSGEANAIRLHPEADIHPDWEHLMVDHDTVRLDGVPLRRTMQFWARPHLASACWYREQVLPVFPESSRTFIEDVLYGVVTNDWHDHGEPGWDRWRLWVYTPPGGMKRSGHIDGRDTDPKYDMWLA